MFREIQQKRSSDIRNSTVANVRSIIRSFDVHDPRGWSLRRFCYHFAHHSTSPKFREENTSKLASGAFNIFNKYFDVFTSIIRGNSDVSRERCKIYFRETTAPDFSLREANVRLAQQNANNVLSENATKAPSKESNGQTNSHECVMHLIPFVGYFIRVKVCEWCTFTAYFRQPAKKAHAESTAKSWRVTNECH